MTLLASDANNTQFVGASNPDSALVARFHRKAVQDNYQTSVRGRPIFNDVDYIEIFTPGNSLNIIDTPVREEHRRRFPQQWAHYQNQHSGDAREIGTPLSQWAFLTGSQVEELKGLKFFTVESLANAPDQQIGNVGMIGGVAPNVLRQRAIAYLNAAAGSAGVEHAASVNAALQAQVKDMQAQLMALQSVAGQTKAAPKEKKTLSPERKAALAAARWPKEPTKAPENTEAAPQTTG